MCDPCEQICCSPYCDPCCPPSPCEPACIPPCVSICDPCSPPACDPCCPPKRCKSRELRSSNLMTNCDCVKRNGLQWDCPRSECKGRPCCTIQPWPSCCPSKYMWRYTNVTMGKPSNPIRPVCKPTNPCIPYDPCCNSC